MIHWRSALGVGDSALLPALMLLLHLIWKEYYRPTPQTCQACSSFFVLSHVYPLLEFCLLSICCEWRLLSSLSLTTRFLHRLRSHLRLSSSNQSLQRHVSKVSPLSVSVEMIADLYADYLTQLRDCIVEGCASAKRPTSQYPDGAEYWKKAYEKAEEERKALLDKLHKHEKQQTVASLFSSPTARSPLTKDGKRKREDTPAAQANSRSKRRTNLSNTPQSPAIDDVSSGYGEALLFGEVSGVYETPTLFTMLISIRRCHEAPTVFLCFAYAHEAPAN